MSGWETAGTKKKSGTKKQKEAAFKPTTIKRAAHVEGTKTLFDIFNDVDADKQKKKEVQEKRAKKAAKAEKYTGAFTGEELSDPRTNFEKSMKAKQEKQKKANSTAKAAKKKDAAAADPAGGGAAARASIADVISRWDTPALLAKLAEIDETYDEDTQEHVMVLMIAEYLEEQFAGAVRNHFLRFDSLVCPRFWCLLCSLHDSFSVHPGSGRRLGGPARRAGR